MNSFIKTTQTISFPVLLHFLLVILFISISPCSLAATNNGCHEQERRALLNIKSSLEDPSHRLISWQDLIQHQNCCEWSGIRCSSESFHVISIDLRNLDFERVGRYYNNSVNPHTALRGKLSPYLFNITNLEYLDLSYNDFQGSEFSHQFSRLTKLTHLDLSLSNFSASISTQFSNLTFLQYLDLSCSFSIGEDIFLRETYITSCLESPSIKWIRGLENLKVLRLRGINLFEATFSKENHISYIWNLRELDISDCNVSVPVFPIHEFHNLSHLSILKMNSNSFISSIPIQFANLTSLSILDLSKCCLEGPIPYLPQLKELDVSLNYDLNIDLNRMFEHPWPRLKKLDISSINASGSIPSSISNAPLLISLSASFCSTQGSLPSSIYNLSWLQHLDLAENQIKGSIHSSISNLKYLQFLDLSANKFQEAIPESICEIYPLQHLNLGYNDITGTIPSCITNLRNLSVFDVSYNSIRGTVSLISLINELNLTTLHLGSNKLTVVVDRHLYQTKFILEDLSLGSCNLKGFKVTSICNLTDLRVLELSNNNLTGAIPSCISKLKKLVILDLSNNRLHGPLPLLPPDVYYIKMSNNKLSGLIPSSICSRKPGMSYPKADSINLSHNKLSGIIPTSIGHCRYIIVLNLNNNNLTGNVPNELQKAKGLQRLTLNNNNLNGTFPGSILKLLDLNFLNLAYNNFEGIIPFCLGSLSKLTLFSLRSNKFNGSIPEEISHLRQLQILDLSLNNFSGPIPSKLGNLTILTGRVSTRSVGFVVQYQLSIKGTTTQFDLLYAYSLGIDLSCNILNGDIPEEIGLLQGLVVLNLSHNLFSSSIPASVGNMSSLESLDLSSNKLSGHIPQSLTSIDTLGYLSLSHNNLSGRIPRGNHFDTLSVNGSAFVGNDLLCGFPLANCEGDHGTDTGNTSPSSKIDEDDQEDEKEILLLYAIVFMGFAAGFWGLFFVLLLKKHKWWFPYWRIVDSVAVKIVEGCLCKN